MSDSDTARKLAEKPIDLKQFEGHTPGPWTYEHDTCRRCREEGTAEYAVYGPPGGYHAPFSNEADAKLVSSAPDLLAELSALRGEKESLTSECKRLDADGDKWMNRAAVAEQKLESAEQSLGALQGIVTRLISAALGWNREHNLYRTAWLREIGGVIKRKMHEIDGFVLRTREIYDRSQEAEKLKAELAALREQTRWIPVSEKPMPFDILCEVQIHFLVSSHDMHERLICRAEECVDTHGNDASELISECGDDIGWTTEAVTHWRALGPGPEGGR